MILVIGNSTKRKETSITKQQQTNKSLTKIMHRITRFHPCSPNPCEKIAKVNKKNNILSKTKMLSEEKFHYWTGFNKRCFRRGFPFSAGCHVISSQKWNFCLTYTHTILQHPKIENQSIKPKSLPVRQGKRFPEASFNLLYDKLSLASTRYWSSLQRATQTLHNHTLTRAPFKAELVLGCRVCVFVFVYGLVG